MENHFYRTLLIVALMVIAAVNIYPTVGWMTLTPDARTDRIERWKAEDKERERLGPDVAFYTRANWGVVRWTEFNRDWVIDLGLDLQGGLHMVLGFDMTPEAEERGLTQTDVQDIILQNVRNRVDEYEAREPIIQRLGANQVQIQLPGEKDMQRAKNLIMKTAQLKFHLVSGRDETNQVLGAVDKHFNNGFVPFLDLPRSRGGSYEVNRERYDRIREMAIEAEEAGALPEDKTIAFSPRPPEWQDGGYFVYVMDREATMTGEGIKSAAARPDNTNPGFWQILFDWDADGARGFADLTGNNVNRALGIVLDGSVMSAPNISQRIFGTGTISGSFTSLEAKDLAIALNSGSLPVPVREDYTAIVDGTLGQDSVQKGVTSSLAGLGIVMIFMLLYYRVAGVIANVSLAANGLLILGAFAYFNVTLTLPGIAGLILTVGMAVDANVLIFERIREEARAGKSLLVSVEGGFANATSAIMDANVTTLIAAAVLLQFGTGPVQGFAVALSIGICTSVFAALVVTRAQFDFLAGRKVVSKVSMTSLLPAEPSFKFLQGRRIAAIASLIAIGVGVAAFGMRGKDNFGVDFTNGTNMLVSVNSADEVSAEDVRAELTDAGFDSPTVQAYQEEGVEEPNPFLIRIGVTNLEPTEGEEASTVTTSVQIALASLSDVSGSEDLADQVKLLRAETVGPAVGAQLQRDAVNAIFFALLFIVFYLWFRFEWKFALGAAVALVHDVLFTLGVLALAGREITIPTIAAILTIIGYSLNDTIVVFDRVREDLETSKAKNRSFLENLNASINRTLSRTLLTSLTTLFVVVVLFVFGGNAINDFAFALMIGIVVGTYSSIFVASPVVYAWQSWRDNQQRGGPTESGSKKKGKGAKGRKTKTA